MAKAVQRAKRSSLFRKIFSRLFLAGIVPLLVIAVTGVTLLYVSSRESNERLEQTLLAQKRAEVDRFLKQTIETFEIFVNYEEDLAIAYPDQTLLLEFQLKVNPELIRASLIKTLPAGTLIRSRNESETEEEYQQERRAVAAPEGLETASIVRDKPPPELRFKKDDAAFLAASSGKSFIGGVVLKDGVPTVELAGPVRNQNGTVVAVLSGDLRLINLQNIFKGAGFGNSGIVFLLDENGNVLAHSQDVSFLGKPSGSLTARQKLSQAFTTSESLSGEDVLTSSLLLANPKWLLVAEWPVADAFAPLISLVGQILLLGALLIAALFVLANVQAKEIVRPIRAIQQAAARIGKGEFWNPLEIRTRDELEDLGTSLTHMANDLARLQEVRSTEVRAQALAQAMEKEQELDEAKDVLLTTASHQFRTPISVLNWNIGLLKTMNLPQDAQELIAGIGEHAANLSMIAGDLLNATAFGAGYIAEPGAEPVYLDRLLDDALMRYRSNLEKKAIVITRDFGETPPSIKGSYGALRIMFDALLMNAITYTPKNGKIEVFVRDTGDGTIGCMIRDTGIGIPEQDKQHLFTAFFRASNAIVAKNVGTGLGLFFARNIAMGHGGTIRFNSQEGKGAEFVVILPKQTPTADKSKDQISNVK